MEQTPGGLVLRWFRARAAGKILYDCLGESFPAADVHQKLQVWVPKSVRTSNHTSGIKWHFDLRPSLSSSMILFGSLFGPGCSRDRGLGLNKFHLPVQGCGTLKTDYGRWCFFYCFRTHPKRSFEGGKSSEDDLLSQKLEVWNPTDWTLMMVSMFLPKRHVVVLNGSRFFSLGRCPDCNMTCQGLRKFIHGCGPDQRFKHRSKWTNGHWIWRQWDNVFFCFKTFKSRLFFLPTMSTFLTLTKLGPIRHGKESVLHILHPLLAGKRLCVSPTALKTYQQLVGKMAGPTAPWSGEMKENHPGRESKSFEIFWIISA